MITNPANVSINAYSQLSTVKKNYVFYWFWSWRSAESSKIVATYLLAGDINLKTRLREVIIQDLPLNPED